MHEFPAQKCRSIKKVRHKFRKRRDLKHGCRIPSELADITCASQGRTTLRSDLPQIAARKTILLHSRARTRSSFSSGTDNSLHTGPGTPLGYIS